MNPLDAYYLTTVIAARTKRRGVSTVVAPRVVKSKPISVSGDARNKPCPCGSGQKAKRCSCEKYGVL